MTGTVARRPLATLRNSRSCARKPASVLTRRRASRFNRSSREGIRQPPPFAAVFPETELRGGGRQGKRRRAPRREQHLAAGESDVTARAPASIRAVEETERTPAVECGTSSGRSPGGPLRAASPSPVFTNTPRLIAWRINSPLTFIARAHRSMVRSGRFNARSRSQCSTRIASEVSSRRRRGVAGSRR